MAGLLVMSLSMLPIGMVGNLQQLLRLFALSTSARLSPNRRANAQRVARGREARGSYMGFSRLGLAIGGAIGYIGGGWLFDMGKALAQPELPWMMLGIIGFITFLALGWQFSHNARRAGCWNPAPDLILSLSPPYWSDTDSQMEEKREALYLRSLPFLR